MSARYSSENAALVIGNKFEMVLIASQRAREIKRGSAPKIETKEGAVVTALDEIELGLVGREYLKKYR